MKRHTGTGQGRQGEGKEGRGVCSVLPMVPSPLLLLHALLRVLLLGLRRFLLSHILICQLLLLLLLIFSESLVLLIFIF